MKLVGVESKMELKDGVGCSACKVFDEMSKMEVGSKVGVVTVTDVEKQGTCSFLKLG